MNFFTITENTIEGSTSYTFEGPLDEAKKNSELQRKTLKSAIFISDNITDQKVALLAIGHLNWQSLPTQF